MGETMDFKDKVVFVTGASRGIGEYIAYEFASLGAHVAVMAKSTAEAPHKVFEGTIESTAENCRKYGVDALEVRGDVSHEDDVQAAYQATMDHFGRCDVLVNNAAVSYVGPFLELSAKRWNILLGVNVMGPVMLSRAFIPQMIERGEGRIVNISSGSGRLDQDLARLDSASTEASAFTGEAAFGDAGQGLGDSVTAYGTSKAALNRLTVGVAQELRGKGVAVNALGVSAVTPAFRYTLPNADFSWNELPEAPAQVTTWLASQPLEFTGRILEQDEIIGDLRAKGLVRPKVDPA
jgi:NAD(P)-dependent dehydrogenase (short-subunit alcohol dehydrogenase family)